MCQQVEGRFDYCAAAGTHRFYDNRAAALRIQLKVFSDFLPSLGFSWQPQPGFVESAYCTCVSVGGKREGCVLLMGCETMLRVVNKSIQACVPRKNILRLLEV